MINATNRAPVLRTTAGQVIGTMVQGAAVYHGVPYAAAPVGAARFAPPAPPPRWTGTRNATRPGARAPASRRGFGPLDLSPLLGSGPTGDADYLTVSVTTPDPGTGGLPVLVFVHGGGFVSGTGQADVYRTTSFARDGVVLVTVDYRLGIAGWLELPDAPSNRGLLDVIAALRWVAANIDAFGGDPARVTVCGQSAGAMIVAALMACRAAQGLFRRAISQSGSGDCAHQPEQAALATAAVGTALGAAATAAALGDLTDSRLAALLDGIPPIRSTAPGFVEAGLGSSPVKPVIDGSLLGGQPADTLLAGTATDLLIGTTTDEANTYTVPSGQVRTATDADLLALARLRFADPEGQVTTYRARFPADTPGRLLTRMITDTFTAGSHRLARAHARRSAGRTFAYEFTWRSPAFGGELGACHGLELPFVFDRVDLPSLRGATALLGEGPPPTGLTVDMHRAWVRFVTEGDPDWPSAGIHRFGE